MYLTGTDLSQQQCFYPTINQESQFYLVLIINTKCNTENTHIQKLWVIFFAEGVLTLAFRYNGGKNDIWTPINKNL